MLQTRKEDMQTVAILTEQLHMRDGGDDVCPPAFI
jgi:hypothetical protein